MKMSINRKQRKIIVVGILVFLMMGIYPPWRHRVDAENQYKRVKTIRPAGYHLIITPPTPLTKNIAYGVEIDTTRLFLQWFMVLVITLLGVYLTQKDLLKE